jgi:hypothetical protein
MNTPNDKPTEELLRIAHLYAKYGKTDRASEIQYHLNKIRGRLSSRSTESVNQPEDNGRSSDSVT